MELFVSTMIKLKTHQSQRDLSEFKAQSFLRLTCNIGKIVLILRENIFPPKSDEGPSKAMSSHELLFEICTVRHGTKNVDMYNALRSKHYDLPMI